MLHRFPKGLAGDKVHQKRLPAGAPPWVETVELHFPRWNRTADELCVTELGSVIWAVQMSTVEFHPWNSRRQDTEKPDEWRIDLDPGPLCDYATVRRVAARRRGGARRAGRRGVPEDQREQGSARLRPDPARPRLQGGTPGRAGVRPRGGAPRPRRRHHRVVAQEPRPHQLFPDWNQNTRDHTIAAAYSVRGLPDARVSTPIRWDEIDDCDPRDLTIFTVPARYADLGDLHADIDDHVFDIAPLLEWADRDEREGAPEPPADPDEEPDGDTLHSPPVGIQITPSILNADFADLGAEVARIPGPTGCTSTSWTTTSSRTSRSGRPWSRRWRRRATYRSTRT